MFATGLYALLTGNAALMATIQSGPLPVYIAETAAYPCLTYRVVSGTSSYSFSGSSYQSRLVQFDAWSNATYAACLTTVNALRNLLDAYQGTLTDGTRVLTTMRENTIDNWDFDGQSYRITAEYRFLIVEA